MKSKLTNIPPVSRAARAFLLITVCMTTGLLGVGLIAAAQDNSSTVLFEMPEDAITFYLQGVMQGDVTQILQATAVTEMSEGFDFERSVNRLGSLSIQSPAPSDQPLYVEINKAQFTSQILSQVKNFAYGLLATEKDVVEGRVFMMEPEGTTRFMDEVDPERLASLRIMDMGIPFPDLTNNELNLENWNEQAQIYGADEFTERVVLLQFEGDTYFMGFTLLRYDESWKISSAASLLGGTSVFGAPMRTTAEDFQDLISDD